VTVAFQLRDKFPLLALVRGARLGDSVIIYFYYINYYIIITPTITANKLHLLQQRFDGSISRLHPSSPLWRRISDDIHDAIGKSRLGTRFTDSIRSI
jgi:hypothetical protein